MKPIRILFLAVFMVLLVFQAAGAQGDAPLALVLDAEGPIMPPMLEYIQRGIQIAEQRDAEVLIIQLNTPGGSVSTMKIIVEVIRASRVPVVVFVSPRGAWAGSAGAFVTMAGHASAMAPETVIGFASPVDGSGADLDETMKAKEMEALTSIARSLTERRGPEAVELAQAMILEARAVTASEALEINLVDFLVDNNDDLLEALDGFTVQMTDGPRTLHTTSAHPEALRMSLIEQILLLLTDPNIVFSLVTIGLMAILIEISSPGGWLAGFIGVVCLALGIYGIGILPVNWFGIIFLVTAFVLFVLDIKAPTHGALTTAGVASFIVGALVLFNSAGTPDFQRVSVPLVIGMGIFLGAVFFMILGFALRAQKTPIRMGLESLAGRTGTAKTDLALTGQVQVGSELWSAEPATGSDSIRKGDSVEVVRIEGLRLIVKKK